MASVSRYLQREWEQVACALAAVLLLAFLADWAWRDRSPEAPADAGRIAETPSVLGPGAFAFLRDPEQSAAPQRNPFLSSAIEAAVPRPPKPTRPEPKPPEPKPPEPKPVPPTAPTAPPTPPEPPRAATPAPAAPRLGQCDLKYVFSTTNRSGRPVALLELQDPARPGAAPMARNVSAGDQVYGLRIQGFTDQALTLVDAAGRRQSVSFGGTRRVTVDLGAAP